MGRLSTISFPGLGIGEFTVNGVALSFSIGSFPITIMWYGIIICLGIFLGFSYFSYRAKEKGLVTDDILDITLVTVLTAIVGARLYFLLFYGGFVETDGTFWQNVKDTLYNIVSVWEGGLAIYGGVIGGFLALLFMSKRKKRSVFQLTDMTVPGVMLGQLVGRWGNFMNGEAFGSETTLPWRMGLCNAGTGYRTLYVHPTFLYESLWNLLGFVLINTFYKKKKYDGEVTMWYFAWYGLGRGFIELLRTDSLMLGGIRVSSLLSFVFVAVLVPMLIVLRRRYLRLVRDGAIGEHEVTRLSVLFGRKTESEKEPSATPTEETSPNEEETENGNHH